VRDLFRQTDGFGQVPSSGAVLNLEFHANTSMTRQPGSCAALAAAWY
jgi:hypothetical protein